MRKKHGISRLLYDLQQLYYRVCAIDLRKRMTLYHRHIGTNEAPDISLSLKKNLDKLTPTSNPNTVNYSSTPSTTPSKRPDKPENAKQSSKQPHVVLKAISSFISRKKIFTSMKTSDPYMGEKLKESTWSHIHAAQLHARQGNINNAKLHAGIANNALKEAAHYMSEDDYKVLCDEVAMVFKKLESK
ncbi:MAG: hypothetical protein KJO03_10550 [Gammaproteobacteria bacterium]|nr:hypothetical protein [Gammaproteobacteria bacterium]